MNGKEFKFWRENARMSMQDVQDITGIWKSAISRFENGKEIKSSAYQKLVDLASGKAVDEMDTKTKIKFHIQQIELLIESEE